MIGGPIIGISRVRYDSEQTHIVKADIREEKGDFLGRGEEWTRSRVVSAIERGKTFAAILTSSDDK